MGIRHGVEGIQKKNEEVKRREANRSFVPELKLYENGDIAYFRILNDDPKDVDFHVFYNGKFNEVYFCSRDDVEGECEYCENKVGDVVRMFMFWIWTDRILHLYQNEDKTWKEVSMANKTYYEEPVKQVWFIRRPFGRENKFWQPFEDVWFDNGTWMDREFIYRRVGDRGDINTYYTLKGRDKSPMPEEVSRIIGKIPPLESIAKGIVTKLDFGDEEKKGTEESKKEEREEKKEPESKKESAKKSGKDKPVVEVELPEVELEELF